MQVHKRLFHRFFSHFVGLLLLVLIGECCCSVSTDVSTRDEPRHTAFSVSHLSPSSTLHIVETPIKIPEITEQTAEESSDVSSSIQPQPSSSYLVVSETQIHATSLTSSDFDVYLVDPSPTSHSFSLSSSSVLILSSREPQAAFWPQTSQTESLGVEAPPTGQPAAQLSHEAMTWMTSAPSSAQHLLSGSYTPHSLPAGTVAGIVIASLGFLGVLGAAVGFLALRRFRPLHAKTYDSSYSSGDTFSYLDNLQVSYINHHVQLPKDSSDEMFSLDNDSFLNSLEAMTMENYWAEESKSTKV